MTSMLETLPTKYYLDHANELFDFVEHECSDLLNDQHTQYLKGIKFLSLDAQCLLVRCLTRKPDFIKISSLNYAEINALESAIAELEANNYVRYTNAEDWFELVQTLTKAQLAKSLEYAPIKIKSSTTKIELIGHARQHLDGQELCVAPLLAAHIVKQRQELIEYVLFLFFGDIRNRFQQFAMRDLGLIKTRKNAKKIARFGNKLEAQNTFELQKRRRDFIQNPSTLKEDTAKYLLNSQAVGHSAQETQDRLLVRVGNEFLESDPEKALRLWKKSNDPMALEKWVRETHKRFDKDKLKVELLRLKDQELAPISKIFIEDFYARKYQGRRTSLFTDLLRESSQTVTIDEAFINDVEIGVIEHYRKIGYQAFFTENKFWRILFGLTFWDLLFSPNQTQYSEFDRLPSQLKDNSFYTFQKNKIEQRLAQFDSPKKLLRELTHCSVTHYGTPNGLFIWSSGLLDSIRPALNTNNTQELARVLKRMALNYHHTKDGYPDLMVIENKQLRFEEIKAPGDVLRPNQLVSISRLRDAGLDVTLTQVDWASNSEQVYAVVDIETTGGRKGGNAITEIAVVQVRDNDVIGEWSSLVNPRRHVPKHITRLTGIDDSMVATAPTFAEIADELERQLDGAIFVAHNVGFDYGFIKAAFESINRPFRKPKFCTVSQSRKVFPGLKSYSLSALTEHFDIDLSNHHRALSDAKATADLLRLIQDTRKRSE